MLSSADIVNRYITFFEKNGHKRIANSPLVPQNDPTTLFTSSGMQPLVPYLLGETHPSGKRLVNVQNCIRAQDIEEVGDNRHTTFFRMMGNWSLGDPASPGSTSQGGDFKQEQLQWFFEYLVSKTVGLGLDSSRLYVTVFAGNNDIPKDDGSIEIWKELFAKQNIEAKFVDLSEDADKHGIQDGRIFAYGVEKNWWSRAGVPQNMPVGEPGGPDSEVFYEFSNVKHDPTFGEQCHPNCDCGRFMEIGNSVFMQYIKQDDGSFKELPQKNVDFGGGLERFAAAVDNDPDVFKTDLYNSIIQRLQQQTGKSYDQTEHMQPMRIITDHLKASVFLIKDNVTPSNKEQGYILRRLLRRAAVKMGKLAGSYTPSKEFLELSEEVLTIEKGINNWSDSDIDEAKRKLSDVIVEEINKFGKSLHEGTKVIEKLKKVDGKTAFYLYQTYGLPLEILKDLVWISGIKIDEEEFEKEKKEHADLSRTSSAGMFKGGLADHSEKTIMGHTATHLLHQALRDVLGNSVHQTGSNITTERVRFDFNYENKLTDEEIEKVQEIVNEKIKENLSVHFELIPTEKAHKMGAIGLFMDTYGDKSKIYFIGGDSKDPKKAYSIEFCGGPHVDFTGRLKSVKIIKQENLGKNQKRIYAVVE